MKFLIEVIESNWQVINYFLKVIDYNYNFFGYYGKSNRLQLQLLEKVITITITPITITFSPMSVPFISNIKISLLIFANITYQPASGIKISAKRGLSIKISAQKGANIEYQKPPSPPS